MAFPSYKKIDDVGRIVLSKDIRHALGLNTNDMLKIEVVENKIEITKAENECLFCKTTTDLISYKGKYICKNCLNALNK